MTLTIVNNLKLTIKHFNFNTNDEDLKTFVDRIKNNVLNDVN